MISKTLALLVVVCGALSPSASAQESGTDYDSWVQKGNAQLQGGNADLALDSGEQASKMEPDRWEAYALAGGALMNLKQYEKAADMFSRAIDRAPEAKQTTLRDLRRQCLLKESVVASASPKEVAPAATSQAEIVLWKSIENSTNPADFQTYLDQYPHGAFAALAERHLAETKESFAREQEEQKRLAATWTDPATSLMWARNDSGSKVSWNQANTYCSRLHLLDYTDWRLPTTDELAAIYDASRPERNKGGLQFTWTVKDTWLWSASKKEPSDAWVVFFGMGWTKPHKFHRHVDQAAANAICVRRLNEMSN